jgi:hypothetical protein
VDTELLYANGIVIFVVGIGVVCAAIMLNFYLKVV